MSVRHKKTTAAAPPAADTALAAAFHKAGIESPTDRLREIALRQMVKHAGNTYTCAEAIWQEIQKDRELLVALFDAHQGWRREVSALMHRVRTDISYAQTMGALQRPVERKAAAVVDMIRAEEKREDDERRAEERAWQAQKDREHEEYLEQWHRTRIGSLEIGDKPVWQCTAGTVRGWLVTQKRRWRTVELLIEGIPDDGRPIEYYRKPDEVEAMWKAAKA